MLPLRQISRNRVAHLNDLNTVGTIKVPVPVRPSSPLPRRPHRGVSSTSASAANAGSSFFRTIGNWTKGTILVSGIFIFGYYITDTRAAVHRYLAVPFLRFLYPDAEDAHEVALKSLRALWEYGLNPRDRLGDRDENKPEGGMLRTHVWDIPIVNPIYISAGLDKHAEAIDALFALGPAIVEIGCVTPYPQPGNARPRVFRLVADNALINRYGFNSAGAGVVSRRLRERVTHYALTHGMSEEDVINSLPASLIPGKLLAVQIGKNKDVNENDIEAVKSAYRMGVRELGRYADVLVVNVSSPNTPGLRKLQESTPLTELLTAVVDEASKVNKRVKPRVVVKISPDESLPKQIGDVAAAIVKANVDGVIVANTTLQRPPSLQSDDHLKYEVGGLSGPPLHQRMTELVWEYRRRLPIEKEVWASGGVSTGKDALEAMRAGAGMVGVYTALTYGGVGTIGSIKEDIRRILRAGKFD